MNPDSRFVAKRQETTEELLEKASQYLGKPAFALYTPERNIPHIVKLA